MMLHVGMRWGDVEAEVDVELDAWSLDLVDDCVPRCGQGT